MAQSPYTSLQESPDGVQSMDGGRSLKLFDWFLLPLLSFCNGGQNDANCAQVVNNGTVQVAPIDEQPKGFKRVFSKGFEAPIRSRSIDKTDSSSSDQLKLTDLPLLALLAICGHLRRNDASRKGCKDLYNFQNTCGTFAYAVNSFFKNPANLPPINDIKFTFNDAKISVSTWMSPFNYVMHPLGAANQSVFNGWSEESSWPRTVVDVDAEFDEGNDEAIYLATESLCGPMEKPYSEIAINFEVTNDINKVFKMLRNVKFTNIRFTCENLSNENGFRILAYLQELSNLRVDIECDKFDLVDAPEFFNKLYSLSKYITLKPYNWILNASYDDRSKAFWQLFLQQKFYQGAKIRYNGIEPFTEETDLTLPDVRLWRIGLSKC